MHSDGMKRSEHNLAKRFGMEQEFQIYNRLWIENQIDEEREREREYLKGEQET